MTMTDQHRPASRPAPAREFATSQEHAFVRPADADGVQVAPADFSVTIDAADARERALAVMHHQAVRAEAERRLLNARSAGALGGLMFPR
ncbi:MAG: hypothetical protein HGA51_10920 [Demequinaceae bacterium]|nr:hypothetical protein [Demequinaceae bacterium]